MELKYVKLNDDLYRYVVAMRHDLNDPVLAGLQKQTDALGDISRMQISPEQGAFLTVLAGVCGARSAIEIGTFTGYSSLCLARGLLAGGRLLCLDQSREWTDIARRAWAQAGVEKQIELRIGPAIETLKALPAESRFDFAFIDAAKSEYDAYYELLLPHMEQNGVFLFDNMLWGGRLTQTPLTEADGKAIDALNRKLAKDARVESVLLPFADGIMMCRKK